MELFFLLIASATMWVTIDELAMFAQYILTRKAVEAELYKMLDEVKFKAAVQYARYKCIASAANLVLHIGTIVMSLLACHYYEPMIMDEVPVKTGLALLIFAVILIILRTALWIYKKIMDRRRGTDVII